MSFPQFDDDNPQLWISRSQTYFEMYSVDPSVWVKVSSMHCTGAEARWLQSIQCRLATLAWPALCTLIHERFSRDQHELLIRQLFHIEQTSTVSDYVERLSN